MTVQCVTNATERLHLHGDTENSVDGIHEALLDALKVLTCFLMNSEEVRQVKDDRERRPLLAPHIALMCLAFWNVNGCFELSYCESRYIRDHDDLVVDLIFAALITLANFDFRKHLFSITNGCEKVEIVIQKHKRQRVNPRPSI